MATNGAGLSNGFPTPHGSCRRSLPCPQNENKRRNIADFAPFGIEGYVCGVNKSLRHTFAIVIICLLSLVRAFPQAIPVTDNLWRLVPQEDTDGDHRITVHDHTTPFLLRAQNGETIRTVDDVYQLSVVLQELKRAEQQHQNEIDLAQIHLNESAADRTHRLIKEYYWDALTRRIDAEHLDQVVTDSKTRSRFDYIYVPASDPTAVRYFQKLEETASAQRRAPSLKVVVLPSPDQIDGEFVRHLDGAHGILSLKLELDAQGRPIRGVPYVVPGGRFNELYDWDSYFIVLGLLQDGRTDLARGMADNLLYEIEHYGKVPNANRTYYLTRSQPPFLTSIIRAVYESDVTDRNWLESALKTAITEYETVWMGKDRLVRIGDHQLSRYYDSGNGPCPEVEPGHYDEKIAPWLALAAGGTTNQPMTAFEFLNQYLYCGKFADLAVNGLTLSNFFKHDRAVRESGHDTTHRFDDRTADFISVDLNSLLYRYEMDFAELIEKEFAGQLPGLGGSGKTEYWRQRALTRKRAMMDLMWDEARGYFFDYDFANRKRSDYISATGLYPLWAKLFDPANATEQQKAKRAVAYACSHLEEAAGLAASARESVEAARTHDARQWDYPYGWPPHQMLAWQALKNYGLSSDAQRLAYRWLFTIAKNAHDYNGTIPEKYNVVTGSHDVFVEYGNVGTKFEYIAPEGFGWMNASFQVGMNYLTPSQQNDLRRLKVPEKE
jgi:alpha,alpha-trehalase